MDKATLRRENLRRWTEVHGIPAKEKSYFSQLVSGIASFGEKSARRLEKDYRMGDFYLDTPNGLKVVEVKSPKNPPSDAFALEVVDIVNAYYAGSAVDRGMILTLCRRVLKNAAAKKDIGAVDES